MRAHMMAVAVAAAVSWSCASGGSGGSRPAGGTGGGVGGGSGIASAATPRGGRDVIYEPEISSRASDAANALQVIQKLRPQMLQTRGLASPTDVTGESMRPKVYVDNVEYGDVSTLGNLVAGQIKEIRYLNARDATTQWGTGHMGGVILIITKK